MTRLLGTCSVDGCKNYEGRYSKGKCMKHARAERLRTGKVRERTTAAGLSSTAVLERVWGLSYRQLDHWTTNGVIKPEVEADGSGTQRRWSEADVEDLQTLAIELVVHEAYVQDIRSGKRWLQLVDARKPPIAAQSTLLESHPF